MFDVVIGNWVWYVGASILILLGIFCFVYFRVKKTIETVYLLGRLLSQFKGSDF